MAGIIFNIHEAVKNSAFNVLQEPIKMFMENQTEAFEKESIINKVFVMKTTDKFREEYRSITAMDGFKPTEDMEVAGISDFEESYNKQFIFQTWTNSFVISKQTLEDKRDMDVTQMSQMFIKSFNRTREQYAAQFIAAGLGKTHDGFKISALAGKGADTVDGTIEGAKQQYFHNAHKPVGHGKAGRNFVQSNKFFATIDGLSNGNAMALNIEEAILDVIGQVESIMSTYKDDKGNIVPVSVDTIVIPQNYRLVDILTRGLKSKYGAAMDGNGVNLQYGKYKLVVSPYLSGVEGFKDADNSLILLSSERNREGLGLVWFDRKPLEVRSYIEDKTEANVWAGRARWGAGFGDFRAMSYITFGANEKANATEITPVTTGVKAVNVVNTVKTKEQA
jgi:hypothetical protein